MRRVFGKLGEGRREGRGFRAEGFEREPGEVLGVGGNYLVPRQRARTCFASFLHLLSPHPHPGISPELKDTFGELSKKLKRLLEVGLCRISFKRLHLLVACL